MKKKGKIAIEKERYNGLVSDLRKLLDPLRKEIEKIMPSIRNQIDCIIKNKINSVDMIEETLDALLSYLDMGYGKKEFKKLNNYYYNINKENSKEYDKMYYEIMKG